MTFSGAQKEIRTQDEVEQPWSALKGTEYAEILYTTFRHSRPYTGPNFRHTVTTYDKNGICCSSLKVRISLLLLHLNQA